MSETMTVDAVEETAVQQDNVVDDVDATVPEPEMVEETGAPDAEQISVIADGITTTITPSDTGKQKSDYIASLMDDYGFTEKQAIAFHRDSMKLVRGAGTLYGGSLVGHYNLGKEAFDLLVDARNGMNTKRERTGSGPVFEKKDADNLVNGWAHMAATSQAVGRDKDLDKNGVEKSIRLWDDIRAYKWIELAKPLVGDAVKTLPWSVVNNHMVPATLAFSKKELSAGLRKVKQGEESPWAEFIKTWVAAYATFGQEGTKHAGETDFRGFLSQAIADQREEIESAKNGNKTAEQLAQEKAIKEAKDVTAQREKVRKVFINSLTDMIATAPGDIADLVASISKQLDKPVSLTAAAVALEDSGRIASMLGSACTKQDAASFLQALASRNKIDILQVVAEHSAKLVEMNRSLTAIADAA